MLGGMALQRAWRARRRDAGEPADTPNIVMGSNVQVCWHKFARYWDVEQRLVPVAGRALRAERRGGGEGLRREHDRRRRDPRLDLHGRVRADRRDQRGPRRRSRRGRASTCRSTWTPPAAASSPRSSSRSWSGTSACPRVKSINASGHKYGLAPLGVGWVVWRDAADLPEELVFHVNYLGGDMPVFAINFSRPGSQVIAQYYNFVRLGRSGYRRIQQGAQDVALHLADEIEKMGPFRMLTARHRSAGAVVDGGGRGQLHGLRALGGAAGLRLAGAGLHDARRPDRPRHLPHRGAARPAARPGRPVPRRHAHGDGPLREPTRTGAPPRRPRPAQTRSATRWRYACWTGGSACCSPSGRRGSRSGAFPAHRRARRPDRGRDHLLRRIALLHQRRGPAAHPGAAGRGRGSTAWRRRSSSSEPSSSTGPPSRGSTTRSTPRSGSIGSGADAIGSICFLVASYIAYRGPVREPVVPAPRRHAVAHRDAEPGRLGLLRHLGDHVVHRPRHRRRAERGRDQRDDLPRGGRASWWAACC